MDQHGEMSYEVYRYIPLGTLNTWCHTCSGGLEPPLHQFVAVVGWSFDGLVVHVEVVPESDDLPCLLLADDGGGLPKLQQVLCQCLDSVVAQDVLWARKFFL